ncbi:site-specific integrase [Candidatus Woesearchaeota archaeon]|nr:site-specific integrase [Candidatus Woesearchaeota archaeon]
MRDVYGSVNALETAKKSLSKREDILPSNLKLFTDWLAIKEDELFRRKGGDEEAKIRYTKTLMKYVTLLKLTNRLFKNKDLRKITEDDIRKVFVGLEKDKLKNAQGKPLGAGTKTDLYNKIFKSGFFEYIGKKELACKLVIIEKDGESEVEFFELEELLRMVEYTTGVRNKLFLFFLFDTGFRIGEALQITKKDCVKRHNVVSDRDEYRIRVLKQASKSKVTHYATTVLPQTVEFLNVYLKDLKNGELLFPFGHTNARMLIHRVTTKAKVVAQPEKKAIKLHTFRKSCATHLLKKGYSIDFVKARLGHKPSSTVIDRYVSYLGLDEEQQVGKIQKVDYKELLNAYQETMDKLQAISENSKLEQKKLTEKISSMELQNKELKGQLDRVQMNVELLNTLAEDPNRVKKLSDALKLAEILEIKKKS